MSPTSPIRNSAKPRPSSGLLDGLPRPLAKELERTAGIKVDLAKRTMASALAALAAGDKVAALDALKATKEVANRSAAVREALGRLHYESQRWHEAIQELLAFRRFTGQHRHDALIAEAYRHHGKPHRTIEVVRDMPASEVSEQVRVEAAISAARAYVDLGKAALAGATLDKAVAEAHTQRSKAMLTRERERQATA